MLLLILIRLLIHQRRLIIGEHSFRSGRTHPHEQLSAGQVVVVVGENVRQLLERLHAVPAAKGTTTLNTPANASVHIHTLHFMYSFARYLTDMDSEIANGK